MLSNRHICSYTANYRIDVRLGYNSRRNDYMGFIPNAEEAAIVKPVRVSFKLSHSWCKYNGTPNADSLFLVHFV
ncbi:hypothetical protein VCR17J2_380020 [Vibrio coralliirubri]|nr:hypothetical protein VCR17J2_380020 [Vibrio coralliirubri]